MLTVLQTPQTVYSQLSPICFWVEMHFSPQRCILLFIIICKSIATQHSLLAFCYLPNSLILVLLYRSFTQRQWTCSFSFNHVLWPTFTQAKASGKMLSWKMHGFPYINHIKSWATCFLRAVFWADTWLLAGEGLYRAGHANPHVFLPLYWELYITSTETILLTVWSRSLLTWSLNRRRDYNKQGQSKSNPPSTRCGFGKLYPGKWSFLKPFVVILLIISLDHASKFIFSSPITKFTNGIDSFWVSLKESRAFEAREMLSWSPSCVGHVESSESRFQPLLHIVCRWSRASV